MNRFDDTMGSVLVDRSYRSQHVNHPPRFLLVQRGSIMD